MPAFDCYKQVHDAGTYAATYIAMYYKHDTLVVSSDEIALEQSLLAKLRS